MIPEETCLASSGKSLYSCLSPSAFSLIDFFSAKMSSLDGDTSHIILPTTTISPPEAVMALEGPILYLTPLINIVIFHLPL